MYVVDLLYACETHVQHKHSLSHNFFSFLDPTATNNSLGPSPASPTPWPPFSPSPTSDVPAAVPIPLLSSSSPTTLPSPYDAKNQKFAAMSPGDQLALGFAIAEFFLGASLWVDGQAGGSVSIAGMGYLVVFDAIGVAVAVLGRKSRRHGETSWSTIRRPYGYVCARFGPCLTSAAHCALIRSCTLFNASFWFLRPFTLPKNPSSMSFWRATHTLITIHHTTARPLMTNLTSEWSFSLWTLD